VLAFGANVHTYYDFRKADVVVSFDADFLACGPASLRYAADFMSRRRVRETSAAEARMNRLYVAETMVSHAGAKADHRLAVPSREIGALARAVAARLGVPGVTANGPAADNLRQWVDAAAADLKRHAAASVVLAGDRQPPPVHIVAHAINHHLGNVGQGKPVVHIDPVVARPEDQLESLRQLADDMDNGRVEVLVILGGNPAYNAPADLAFAERMRKLPLRFRLGLYQDETSLQCQWHMPEAHYLETWGDTRAFDGTASIAQPLIEPLDHGRSCSELLAVLAEGLQTPGREIVRAYWRRHLKSEDTAGDCEQVWETALHDGVIAGTKFPEKSVSLKGGWQQLLQTGGSGGSAGEGLEIVFAADPTVYDGRFANNAWLQELPKPLTEIAWDNAVLMSPATA
jgi:molybdopterin-containing oxidoreductase family iron-sulfur binding subunit